MMESMPERAFAPGQPVHARPVCPVWSSKGHGIFIGGVHMQLVMRLVIIVALAAPLLSGCSTKSPQPAQPAYIVHRVQPGETLACIAKWYAGKESQWSEILQDNPGLNPRNLQEHDVVKVATDIATLHTQQPSFSLASRCVQVAQPVRRNPRPLPPPTSTTEVFGPK